MFESSISSLNDLYWVDVVKEILNLQSDANDASDLVTLIRRGNIRMDQNGDLTMLNLMEMNLRGCLFGSIGKLASLEYLYLSFNEISGSIPDEIGMLSSLRELDLSGNKFSGTIPSSFRNLTGLRKLYSYANGLSGPLPVQVLKTMPSLVEVDLSSNQFTGGIPDEIGDLVGLSKLYIQHNCLGGSLPTSIGRLRRLQKLDCSFVGLTGTIPPAIGLLTGLEELNLPNNKLHGEIPTEFGNLTSLIEVNLAANALTGPLPESLSRLRRVKVIALVDNEGLCGPVPHGIPGTIFTNGTGLHQIKLKTKVLATAKDRALLTGLVAFCYVDLFLDLLAINEFVSQRKYIVGLLNAGILVLNVLISVGYASGLNNKVLALLQLQPVVEAHRSLTAGRETEAYARLKKIESICRSIPSAVIQFYGLITGLTDNGGLYSRSNAVILLSVAFSVVASSMMMTRMAEAAGPSMFSQHFAVLLLYYICELCCRVIVVSMAFVAIGAYAVIIFAVDFFMRVQVYAQEEPVHIVHGRAMQTDGSISQLDLVVCALMSMGSDGWNGFTERYQATATWGTLVTLTSLILFNTISTDDLSTARNLDVLTSLTSVCCAAWLLKNVILAVLSYEDEEQEETGWQGLELDFGNTGTHADPGLVQNVLREMAQGSVGAMEMTVSSSRGTAATGSDAV